MEYISTAEHPICLEDLCYRGPYSGVVLSVAIQSIATPVLSAVLKSTRVS